MQKKSTLFMFPMAFLLAIGVAPKIFGQSQSDTTSVVKPTTDTTKVRSDQTQNRNVMLNAESNTGPRNVNIGLPFTGDVIILENNVPVVYTFWPTIPTTVWRYDNSLSEMGLLSFSEGALTQGRVGYAVMSSDRNASSTFKGFASIYLNSFGSTIYDATVTGPIGNKGWGYTASLYECFDRGTGTDWKYTPWSDRTQIAKLGISKKYDKGFVRFLYKGAESEVQLNRYNPLVYEGDGETSPIDGFKLGQDSYVLRDGMIPYYDAITGQPGFADMTDDKWSQNISHNFYLVGQHKFANNWKLDYTSMFQKMKSPFSINFPISLLVKDPDQQQQAREVYKLHGTNQKWDGAIQWVTAQMMPQSDNEYFVNRVELAKKVNNHGLRFGLQHQSYSTQSQTNAGLYMQTVEANPQLLDYYVSIPGMGDIKVANNYGLMPAAAGGYGSTQDNKVNKLAFYASDDFKLSNKIDLNVGARIERQNNKENRNPYINDFALDRPFIDYEFKNMWNKVFFAETVVKLTKNFGLLGDVTYNSWNTGFWSFPYKDENGNPIADPSTPGAKPQQTLPDTYETDVLNYGGGVFLNLGTKFSLVSKVTRISKNGNFTTHSITNPANTSERMTFSPIFYDLSTLGWTTDIVTSPFKNFNLHFLVTLQKPKYHNYKYSAFDVTYDYSDKVIPGLSQTLLEIDPSYTFKQGAFRVWLSLRYFGKQYANPTNAFHYNGWWENFGGVDYRMSRNVSFKLQIANFLNQEGVKGVLQGADQIVDATSYIGRKVVAGGIRPRTVEFTTNFKF